MDETSRRAALSDLYALPGHLLWRAAARVAVELDRILPGAIDVHAYAALLALADREPQSQRSLARLIGVSGTTLTSVAHTLQKDGLVERVRNPEDRRSYSLTRTAAGKSAVRRWAPHVDRLEAQLTAAFTEVDAERLRELLVLVLDGQLDERTPKALLHNTAFLVTRAQQQGHREFAAALQPLGIEPRHFGTMRALKIVGPATQGEVASLLDVSPATVVQIADHLEKRGLVMRQRDASDRRVQRLHLAPRALVVVDDATAISSRMFEDRLGAPHSQARKDLVRLLSLLLSGHREARTGRFRPTPGAR
jgi:DNA-binding MarR family transcriptional regulator